MYLQEQMFICRSVVTGFSVKMSTALSQAVIAGGALGSTAYALSRRHPLDRKRPLVDFELTLMLTPMLLLGVSAGGRRVCVHRFFWQLRIGYVDSCMRLRLFF